MSDHALQELLQEQRGVPQRSNQAVTNQPLLELVFHLDNASLHS